jgi:hypothetical protein
VVVAGAVVVMPLGPFPGPSTPLVVVLCAVVIMPLGPFLAPVACSTPTAVSIVVRVMVCFLYKGVTGVCSDVGRCVECGSSQACALQLVCLLGTLAAVARRCWFCMVFVCLVLFDV